MLGQCALARSLALFAGHPEVDLVQPVIGSGDGPMYAELGQRAGLPCWRRSTGGATRQASVRAGLAALAAHRPDVVLIHDAARPFASPALVSRAILAGSRGAAVPGVPVTDTIKAVDGAETVEATVDRSRLRAVQTPQAFPFALIWDLHARAAAAGRDDFTDDAALAEWAKLPVEVFAGEPGNTKLTTPDDFTLAEARLLSALADVRTGSGFDVHAFGDGDHVILGGLKIPFSRGLAGHSDADVVLHALTDAVLGAIGSGDIGFHFPPSDPKWKGAASDQFLAHAVELVKAKGGLIAHLDATVICEAPKIGPHREAMRASIAKITGLVARPGVGEGHHHRAARLHRPAGGHRGAGQRHRAPAVERDMTAPTSPLRAARLLDTCRARGLIVATAKSCTGGLVAAALTDIAGSSDVVDRGFVTYSNDAKSEMLGVPPGLIAQFGAVSRETARGHGGRRARPVAGGPGGGDHRHRRPRRRHRRQAGRPRPFRRRTARRPPTAPRRAVRRHRPRRGAPGFGGGGAGHASGAGRDGLSGFRLIRSALFFTSPLAGEVGEDERSEIRAG